MINSANVLCSWSNNIKIYICYLSIVKETVLPNKLVSVKESYVEVMWLKRGDILCMVLEIRVGVWGIAFMRFMGICRWVWSHFWPCRSVMGFQLFSSPWSELELSKEHSGVLLPNLSKSPPRFEIRWNFTTQERKISTRTARSSK